jgi:hypothetical protein
VALALAVAQPAPAQSFEAAPPRVSVSLSVGTIGVTDLQTQPVLAARLGEDGETETTTLVRTITGGSGRSANAAVVITLSPAWGLRVGASAGTIRLAHGFTGPQEWADAAREIPVAAERDVGILAWDSAVRYRIPTDRLLRPYVEVGIAAERWDSRSPLPGGAGDIEALTRIGGHAAVGGDYLLTDRLALGLRAATRVLRTPLAPVAAGMEIGRTDTLVLTAEPPDASRFADTAVELVRGLRLELGLSYRAGGRVAAPPDQSESDGSLSALRH